MCVLPYHVIKEAVLGAHFRPNVDRQLAHTHQQEEQVSSRLTTRLCHSPRACACAYVCLYVCPCVYVYLFEHGHL